MASLSLIKDSMVTSIQSGDNVKKQNLTVLEKDEIPFSREVDQANNPVDSDEFAGSVGDWIAPVLKQADSDPPMSDKN